MISAPDTFDEFLKKLFVVDDASMAFWHGDMPVEYEDRARRWNALVNGYYLKQTVSPEAEEYFHSFPIIDRIYINGTIQSVEKFIQIYNCHIRNSEITCRSIFGNLHIEFIVEDILETGLCFQCVITIDKLADYFKKNLLGVSPSGDVIVKVLSRFEIMEYENSEDIS